MVDARQHMIMKHLCETNGWVYCEGCKQAFRNKNHYDSHLVHVCEYGEYSVMEYGQHKGV